MNRGTGEGKDRSYRSMGVTGCRGIEETGTRRTGDAETRGTNFLSLWGRIEVRGKALSDAAISGKSLNAEDAKLDDKTFRRVTQRFLY